MRDDTLHTGAVPVDPIGQVLMLHGGAERGHRPVNGRSLSLRRTRFMYDAIAPPLARAGVVVSVLRFTVNGWNARDPVPSPVPDTRAAIAGLASAHPDLPIVLVGHSMGARAAAQAADAENVVGVLGLAPWFPAKDPVAPLAGRHLVAAHGSRDRITSAKETRRFLDQAATVAASTRFVDMGSVGHYMVSGLQRWNRVAIAESLNLLQGSGDVGPDGGPDVGRVT
jgi:pimeloyl-ACP methyl ester carboxylesterase